MNGALDPLHEGGVVSLRGTQRLCFPLKDISDGLDRSAGYKLVEDLMLEQVGPCSILEFIQSSFKEGCQLLRGMDRHGDGKTMSAVTPPITAGPEAEVNRCTRNEPPGRPGSAHTPLKQTAGRRHTHRLKPAGHLAQPISKPSPCPTSPNPFFKLSIDYLWTVPLVSPQFVPSCFFFFPP